MPTAWVRHDESDYPAQVVRPDVTIATLGELPAILAGAAAVGRA
jgi:hypothetical protein